jgi:hypothetical protein
LLRINVALDSGYSSAIDIMTISSYVTVLFSEKGNTVLDVANTYVGYAHVEWSSRTLIPGVRNIVTFLLPIDFDLLDGIEGQRRDHDVAISMWIKFNGIERDQPGTLGQRTVFGDVLEDRTNVQWVSEIITKSRWLEFLAAWGYSGERRNAASELAQLIREAREAKNQAEEAAKAAREASSLTAVTNLSQAYSDEAKVLGKRSLLWFALSVAVAGTGGYLMFVYVATSLDSDFTVPKAIIRAVVIAAVFGAFTLCLRIYEAYRHLEVVNRHRVNIGRTFEAFKAAQPTDRAKEIMAAVTAENMLAFGKSGFGGKDSPNQGPLAGASELIKAVLEKQGP